MSKIEKVEELTNMATSENVLARFAVAANENRANLAARLSYIKGRWIYGKEKKTLELGTCLVAVMDKTQHGYVKWRDGKIVGAAVGLVVNGFTVPSRDKLDERDEDKWPYGRNGQPEDPWQKTIWILFTTLDGAEMFQFLGGFMAGSRVPGFCTNTRQKLPRIPAACR